MTKQLFSKGKQRGSALVTLLLLAVVAFAVPAKPSKIRQLTLSDGTTPTDQTALTETTAFDISYYKNANGKKGPALKTALCGIIYNRSKESYDELLDAFKKSDVRSDGKIWDMYSNITNYTPGETGGNSAEGAGYNREHSFPKSWFGGKVNPMYSDLNHVYPTDAYINNSMRGNLPFGETANSTKTSENGFSKVGPCSYPDYTGTVFEPNDEYKGDFARTYFYMVTCYEEKIPDWYKNNSESRPTLDGKKYPGLQPWQLEMLMKWAKNDPVSEKEINRNNAVYDYQTNRNPFIDYPGLEEYIWGSMTETAFSYDNYVKPDQTTDPEPVEVGSYVLVTDASTLAAGDNILIAYINGDDKYVLSTTQQNTNRKATNDVTLNTDGTLMPGETAQVITLVKHGKNYLFNVGDGYLYAASSAISSLKTEETPDENAEATISISEGSATIEFQGDNKYNNLRFNANKGNPIFSCYHNKTTLPLPQIYREVTTASITLSNNGTDNSSVITTNNNQAANVTLSGRTLKKNGEWNTICLPFDVTLAGSVLEGATAKTLTNATMEGTHVTLTFGDAVTKLEAGVPYIIKWASGEDIVNPLFSDVTIKEAARTILMADGNVKFIGYYDAFNITTADEGIYYMTSGNKLVHTGIDRTLKACRAYFQLSEAAAASELVVDFGNDVTGINTLNVERGTVNGEVYNLAGQRVTNPTKGVYIVNGKKVIVK